MIFLHEFDIFIVMIYISKCCIIINALLLEILTLRDQTHILRFKIILKLI